MGDNEVRLVRGYLRLSKELEEAKDNHNIEIIKAKMEGIVFAYETYVSEHWATFDRLLERYEHYNR